MGYFLLAVVVGFLGYQIIELYRDIKRKKNKNKEENESRQNEQNEQSKTE